MGLLDLLQQGYQGYKQSDVPVAALLRGEYDKFIPFFGRGLAQGLEDLTTVEGAGSNPIAKVGGLLGTTKKIEGLFDPRFNSRVKEQEKLRQQGLLETFSNPTTSNPAVSGGLLQPSNKNLIWNYPNQPITSADTSINSSKLPAAFTQLNKEGAFKKGSVNIDIGGGRFNNADELLQKSDATNLVYDPFNRTKAHNANVVDAVSGGNANTATINNVLNVIDGEANQLKVLKQAKDAVKKDGEVFISVYQGKGDGVGKATSKGFQQNKKTKDYLELVKKVFPDAKIEKNIIRATNN